MSQVKQNKTKKSVHAAVVNSAETILCNYQWSD